MEDYRAEVVEVEIFPHENADRLELAQPAGTDWVCVVGKDQFKTGDLAIYVPIDSVVPDSFVQKYLAKSKIQIPNNRIHSVKIRGVISQGLLVPISSEHKKGQDVTDELGIKHYEPPEPTWSNPNKKNISKKQRKQEKKYRKYITAKFPKYTKLRNHKNYKNVLQEGTDVVICEKIHGCLKYDTKILLADGKTALIRDLVCDNFRGDVLGVDKNGNITPTKVTMTYDNGSTKEWLRVKTTRKRMTQGNAYAIVKCTPNHKFWCSSQNKYIEAHNLKASDKILMHREDKELSYVQQQMLLGIMLGDGGLNNRHISFSHKEEHEEYINHTLKMLGDIACPTTNRRVSGYGTKMVRARTIDKFYIEELFQDWCMSSTSNRKQVPKSIIGQLGPIALAFWYMDDGTLTHYNGQEDRVGFATCSFNEDSINIILEALKCINIEGIKYRSDNNKYWRIRLNANDAEKLFIMIAPYIAKCMRYKLPKRYRDTPHWCLSTASKYKPNLVEQEILDISYLSEYDRSGLHRYDLETTTHNFFANGILVHNSNHRCTTMYTGGFKYPWYQKLWRWLTRKSNWEFIVGSHNVIKWNDDKVYCRAAKEAGLDKLGEEWNGYIFFGEVYGKKIQHLSYGVPPGELKLAIFDIMYMNEYGQSHYLPWCEVEDVCEALNLETAPVLYKGPWSDDLIKLADGKSTIPGAKHIREGFVVRPANEQYHPRVGRLVLKRISDAYLLDKNATDNH